MLKLSLCDFSDAFLLVHEEKKQPLEQKEQEMSWQDEQHSSSSFVSLKNFQ